APLLGREVEHKTRLVELHPWRTSRMELREEFGIHRQHGVEKCDRWLRRHPVLRQQQERQRAKEHWTGENAGRLRLQEFGDWLAGRETELLRRIELGDDVVVVRVEPLRHFHR